MQALAMIDMAPQKPEVVAPVKGRGKSEQSFDKVFNAKQDAQSVREYDAEEQSELESLPAQENLGDEKVQDAEFVAITANDVAFTEETLQSETCVSAPQGKVQQALVTLMKSVGRQSSDETTVEDLELLVNDFIQQLDHADLHGEQVLAGVDLSALTKELDAFKGQENQDIQLQNLVDELKEQLVAVFSGTENVAVKKTPVAASQQPVVEEMNLSQMRQVLQQAIDVVTRQQRAVETNTVDTGSEVEQQAVENVAQVLSDTSEEADPDPRFAGLLKPRGENGLRQQKPASNEQSVMLNGKDQVVEQKQGDSTVQTMPEAKMVQSSAAETELSSDSSAKRMQMMDTLIQQTTRHQQPHGQAVPQNAVDVRGGVPQTPVVQLASGQAVTDGQVFDQVVTHLSGSFNGESGRMVLRLQPAELGSLRLEMKIEGDRIQANLQAQNQQVQEVLERNLPQLRSALAEQGLKIDQFQVNIDRQQQGGQFENLAQQQQEQNSRKQPSWQRDMDVDEKVVPLAHLMQNGGGGISLHV